MGNPRRGRSDIGIERDFAGHMSKLTVSVP
jgi:hypothetical protein